MAGWTKLLRYLVLLSALCAGASAQSPLGSLAVTVTDFQAKPLEGAAVSLHNRATGAAAQAITALRGTYRFADLAPGAYSLLVTSPQLGQGSVEEIDVPAGHEVRIRLALQLALVAREEVVSNSPSLVLASFVRFGGSSVAGVALRTAQSAIQTAPRLPDNGTEIAESTSRGAIIAAAQIQALPLAGRDWQTMFSEVSDPAGDEGQSAHRQRALRIDGADTSLAFGNTHALHARGPGAALMGPGSNEASMRVVQEFAGSSASTNSRNGLGPLVVTTERGGQKIHGHESLVDRQNLFGAQNPFTQWVKLTAPATATTIPVFTPTAYTPENHEMTWSLAAGGPLRRRTLFWFTAIEGLERNDPAVSTVRHPENFFAQPSNDEMQVLSARLGLSSTNPVVEGLAAYSGMLQSLDGLLGPAMRVAKRGTGFAREDWAPSEHQRFTLEGSAALWHSFGGGLSAASEDYGTHSYGTSRVDDQWILARWESFPRRDWAAITQASVGRQFVAKLPEPPSPFEQTFNISQWNRLPQMTVDSRYGFTIGNPARFGPGAYPDEHLYQIQEQLDRTHAGTQLRAGLSVRHNNDATGYLRNQTGTYHYASAENFASDALAFAVFGLSGQLNPMDQHNCDQTGKAWRDSAGTLHGLGYLPCYAWYSQTMGPSNWWLSTNDWSGYFMAERRANKSLIASLGLRWELQQTPQSIALVNNPDLPLTGKPPSLGSQWGPHASLAWSAGERHSPVLRIGYGMFFGRTPNLTFEDALTQTGSPKGNLNYFMRPTDNLNTGGSPPFPYVLAGEPGTVVKPAAVEFAPDFRNGEVHQASASLEETLPSHIHLDASAVATLGRRLPVTEDTNIDPAVNPKTITYSIVDGNGSGPIKASKITVPFFASWPSPNSPTGFAGRLDPSYQQVLEIASRANSTYEAAVLRLTRNSRDGLTFHARYSYAHAADWNPIETPNIVRPSVFDPTNLQDEYGTSDLDVRHSATAAVIWQPHWRVRGEFSAIAHGWMLSGIGALRSGLPYTMRTAGGLAKEFDTTGASIVALAPGLNGYGGENRVYGVGRNTYRYPATWKADLRMAKRFDLGSMRQVEVLAESFNLFNHQNVTELETVGYSLEPGNPNGGLPRLNFLTGPKTGQTEFGRPLSVNAADFYRPRQVQFGLKMRF